ncbi:MAG: PTS sugar transporter subunit IIA [Erysipelotrichaceae bacterium]
MLGIVVCTHSNFAQGIKDAVEMITGKQENFDVFGFQPGEDMLELSEKLTAIAKQYEDRNEKYVFLVDLFGATPFNASAAGLAKFDTSIITGVNLPILLEIVLQRDNAENVKELLEASLTNAKESMKIVSMKEMFQ